MILDGGERLWPDSIRILRTVRTTRERGNSRFDLERFALAEKPWTWGEAAQPVAEAVRFKVAPKAPLTSSSSQCLAAFVHTASVSSGVGTAGALRCEFERADPEPKSPENKGISNFDAPQSRREIPTGV